MSHYGLDGWTFQRLVIGQDGACAICGKPLLFHPEVRAPAIDHDHVTGKVRGILCQSCSLRVGWFEQAMKNGSLVFSQHLDGFAVKIARYLNVG